MSEFWRLAKLFNAIFLPIAAGALAGLVASLEHGVRSLAGFFVALALASPFIAYALTIRVYRRRRNL